MSGTAQEKPVDGLTVQIVPVVVPHGGAPPWQIIPPHISSPLHGFPSSHAALVLHALVKVGPQTVATPASSGVLAVATQVDPGAVHCGSTTQPVVGSAEEPGMHADVKHAGAGSTKPIVASHIAHTASSGRDVQPVVGSAQASVGAQASKVHDAPSKSQSVSSPRWLQLPSVLQTSVVHPAPSSHKDVLRAVVQPSTG